MHGHSCWLHGRAQRKHVATFMMHDNLQSQHDCVVFVEKTFYPKTQ